MMLTSDHGGASLGRRRVPLFVIHSISVTRDKLVSLACINHEERLQVSERGNIGWLAQKTEGDLFPIPRSENRNDVIFLGSVFSNFETFSLS
jgi:hypothetical protein